MSLRNKSRLAKLEKQSAPGAGADWWKWCNAYFSIIFDAAYDDLSETEKTARFASLGDEPERPHPLPLFLELAETINHIYDPLELSQ